MIKVIAKNLFKQGSIENALSLYEELVEKSRAEKGCLSYELFQDTENPCILTMLETWESKEYLKAHSESEHFKRIVPQLGKMREQHEINVYVKVL